MNCNDANEILERMTFEEVSIDASLQNHLDTCSACNQLYKDTMKSRVVLDRIRRWEPVLNNPDALTDNVLLALPQDSRWRFLEPLSLQQLLAAASVALLLLFGYEQYSVVSKITLLEKQLSEVSKQEPSPRSFATINIQKAGISFAEIERILSQEKEANILFKSYKKKRLITNK